MAEEMKYLEPFVDARAVAKHFNLALNTVRVWGIRGKIPSHKFNGCRRFRLGEIEEYFAKNEKSENG